VRSAAIKVVPAPVAFGWSGRRVGPAPPGKRRLFTAHTRSGHVASEDQAENRRPILHLIFLRGQAARSKNGGEW
jgi:hypothetical protein